MGPQPGAKLQVPQRVAVSWFVWFVVSQVIATVN